MKLQDTIWLGVKGISERKFRTALTVLCVVIGIAAIVSLVSLVAGFSVGISKSLESIGPTTIFIIPSPNHPFTDADIAVLSSLPNVSSVVPVLTAPVNVTVGSQHIQASLVGVNNYSLNNVIGNLTFIQGSVFNNSATSSAIVGYDIAYPNSSSVSQLQLNQPIYMTLRTAQGARSITLVTQGILNKFGSSSFISPDTDIIIPLPAAENLLERYSYNEIFVKATNTSTTNALDSLITTIYGNSAQVLSVQQLAATISSVTGSISLLLGSIAGISLIVAGISILSIMMVSVTERTREIGILKSLGFRKSQILILFLTEAVVIGALGGVIGVVMGAGGAYLLPVLLSGASSHASASSAGAASSGSGARVASGGGGFSAGRGAGGATSVSSSPSSSSTPSITPIVTPEIIVGAILLAIIVSVFSSLYPAWKASTVDPIKALRSE